jgi:polar amino acid transport system ATP-binding protein
MTQIVVTHEMRFAKNASDFIVYMEHGEIIEIAPGNTLFSAPRDERTRRFLKPYTESL